MSLSKIIKKKIDRLKVKKELLEELISESKSSGMQKHDFVHIRTQIETLEDVLDMSSTMDDVFGSKMPDDIVNMLEKKVDSSQNYMNTVLNICNSKTDPETRLNKIKNITKNALSHS